MAVHSAHHFYNFNQLVSGFIAQNKKVTNNVHLMKFENLKTCGSLWGNNSNSTHVDWWTAKHHFSRPRHKQDCNPRGPGMRIVVYTRNLLPVSRPRGQPSRYLKLSNNSLRTASSDMKLENNKSVNLEIESVGVRHMNGGSSKINRPRSEGWRPLAGPQKPCFSIEKADH